MPTPEEYIHCDELGNLPGLNRENYYYEHNLLVQGLPQDAQLLQVGSMDGMRAVRLLAERPDLHFTGLELEEALVELARTNVLEAGATATFVQGDITVPPSLPRFDYVACLNNTLGYIQNQAAAIKAMKNLGKTVVISVYGENFTDQLAHEYFAKMDTVVERIEGDTFVMVGGWRVRRYTRADVESWRGAVTESPLGYMCVLGASDLAQL